MAYIEPLFLWFVIYSILGWVYETILCSVKQKRFINRGFLNGPYCPIYGCGAVLDILLLGKITNPVLLFLAAALLTGVIAFGIFSLVLILFLHPAVSTHTAILPETLRTAVAATLFSILLIDTIYTIAKFSEFEKVLQEMKSRLSIPLISTKTRCARKLTNLNGRIKMINSQVCRMILSFPKLKSIHFEEELKKLRELIQSGKNGNTF